MHFNGYRHLVKDVPTSSPMANKGQKYMHSGYTIRDFRKLLSSLYLQLRHLTTMKKLIKNPCLSSLMKYANKKICCHNTHYIYIYIYTYIYFFFFRN